jgi:hypothetical protein
MFYVQVHALAPESADDAGGAYVSCWINADNETDAEITALQTIEDEGWKPEEVAYLNRVERAEYLGTESLEHFDSAIEDGACFVFHIYPPE